MVTQYIHSKRNAWAPTTLHNTEIMLKAHGSAILEGNPEQFFEGLTKAGYSPSSLNTIFVIAAGYYEFVNPTKVNVFKQFRKDNRNGFKNKEVKRLEKTYSQVKAEIEAQAGCWQKAKALYLLSGALRSAEGGLQRVMGSGSTSNPTTICGKGGKFRTNYATGDNSARSYYAFYRWLTSRIGIPPHALRKLALTQAADNGATAADLCAIAGWSSIAPAFYYLQPKDSVRLKSLLQSR